MGDEFGTTVRCDMSGYSVLGEDVHNKELGELGGGDGIVGWNEY